MHAGDGNVHTNIPGEALTESQKYGTLELAKIENMRTQAEDLAAGRKAQSTDDLEEDGHDHAAPAPQPQELKPFGFLAVCAGDGLAAVFADLGVDGIVNGGQTMNPSTESILTEADIADFTAAGADIILLPAPGTVPGITMEYARALISCAHRHGALTITAIGTSQEGADVSTIRQIALMCKMAGADIHHIGDTGVPGMALPQNIMAYSIAIRGERHTYHKMAQSVNR